MVKDSKSASVSALNIYLSISQIAKNRLINETHLKRLKRNDTGELELEELESAENGVTNLLVTLPLRHICSEDIRLCYRVILTICIQLNKILTDIIQCAFQKETPGTGLKVVIEVGRVSE